MMATVGSEKSRIKLNRVNVQSLHTVEGEFQAVTGSPITVEFVNGLVGAFATPSGMFVDLIVGGLFQAVVTVNPTSGDVGPGSAMIAME